MNISLARTLRGVDWATARYSLVPCKGDEPPAVHSPLFSAHGVVHAFLGRGGNGANFQHVKQVHGTDIVAAGANTAALTAAEARPRADGVFTMQRGHSVAVKTADCVPILCCDRETRNFALAVHAGRRGLLAGIVARAVSCLAAQGLSCRSALWAIGPAIGAAAYEVGPAEMEALHGADAGLSHEQAAICLSKGRDDRWHLDLQLVAVLQLLNCGIAAAQVSVVRICTYTAAQFFYSFRFDKGHFGSNWSYVALS